MLNNELEMMAALDGQDPSTIDPQRSLNLKSLDPDQRRMPDDEIDGKVIDTEGDLKKKKNKNGG